VPWGLYLFVAISIAVRMVKTWKQALIYGRICLLCLCQHRFSFICAPYW
jgi:hypothetical protein